MKYLFGITLLVLSGCAQTFTMRECKEYGTDSGIFECSKI